MYLKKNVETNNQTQQNADPKQAGKQIQFATKISSQQYNKEQSDEIKILSIKLDLLKAGLIDERKKKKDLKTLLQKNDETINKSEEENKRKQKKYQSLTAEIKKLKDDLIQQRNLKSKICQQLASKQQQNGIKPTEEKKATLNLFGFRSFFSRDN